MFLKFKGEKVWPVGNLYFRIDTGDKVDVDLKLEVDLGWVDVELWDFDFLSFNDHLGTFTFNVDDTPGEYSTSMKLLEKNSTASYIMHWEIL
ncbi:hypothetical protein SAMN04488028_103340 [Reichenbachiella agariperforans]|uniref:Uncharacterized protein n=2 Tax=Reichenbachiellaceae TaxID=2762302 RepID=A0A1M6QIT6_REIAG|nr:hypothetical protein SAMN04488028_103340 [Reichenbachiella agariperforans]